MKKVFPFIAVLFLIAFSSVTPKAAAEDLENGYYFQQLNGFQREIYYYILSGEKLAGQYCIHSEENLSLYSEEQLARLVKDAGAACDLENPETTAWFGYMSFESYDEATNSVTVTIGTNEGYDTERMQLVSSLLDIIAEKADPDWDRYTKAKYIASTVSSAMVYFDDVFIYESPPVQNYEKQHLVGVLNGTAVCEGYSELFVAIANRIGLPCVEVSSKGHSFVHIQMEDGNWYGQDGQYELQLEGSSMYQGVQTESGMENIYEIWDGVFEYLVQPRRAENHYQYEGPELQIETVDVQRVVAEFDYGEPEFLYSINSDGRSCTITGYKGIQTGDLILPDELNGLPVTAVGDGAFAFCRYFDGCLTIPDNVTLIGISAFTHCSGLTGDLRLPDKLKEIGDGAFSGCCGFDGKILYNSSLESIGTGAFSECSGLVEGLAIPDSVMSIGNNAFYHCNSLLGILHIPDALGDNWNAHIVSDGPTILGFNVSDQNCYYSVVSDILYSKDKTVLYQCPAGYDGEVIIADGTTTVSDLAFYQCNSVTSIHFPFTLKQIGYMAFCDMEGITQRDLQLPTCIESVGSRAFRGWLSSGILFYPATDQVGSEVFESAHCFDTIIIPNGVTALPDFCFNYCVNVHNIVIPASVESFGARCFDQYVDINFYVQKDSYAEAYISEHNQNGNYTIHYMNADAWKEILGLSTFILPEKTVRVESSAFSNTAAQVVIIPKGSEFISSDAFDGCNQLIYIVNRSNLIFSPPEGVMVINE